MAAETPFRKLLERLTGPAEAVDEAPRAVDQAFFSTFFQDRREELGLEIVAWNERGAELRAQPIERQRGAEMLAAAWSGDRRIAGLAPEELARIALYFHFVSLPAQQQLIAQDETGDYMAVVLEGSVAVDRLQPWGGTARMSEAHTGDILGELSLFDDGVRLSACTTLAPCVLAILDVRGLDAMFEQQPRLAAVLLASVAKRLALRMRQTSARLSALLSRS